MKMNTHLRFGYLFVVLFGLLVVSCHSTPDTVVLSLSQAERIMESDPDSAMTILSTSQLLKAFMAKLKQIIAC